MVKYLQLFLNFVVYGILLEKFAAGSKVGMYISYVIGFRISQHSCFHEIYK